MANLNHLWQRFLLSSALVVGLFIGVAATVFGYSNLASVNIHWSVLHIDGVPLWTVAVVPIALILIAGTLYHWMDGLHHFTEHMRHRRRVHELEAEVASLRTRLDQVLEMPDHSGLPAEGAARASLPKAEGETPAPTVVAADLPALPEPQQKGSENKRKRAGLPVTPEPPGAQANGAEAAPPPEPAEPPTPLPGA
ncbi:MAG TPA: hypothetical protein VGA41_03660 [Candidatus Dormibacteraeota bacterium]